jgi:hypothetical protein
MRYDQCDRLAGNRPRTVARAPAQALIPHPTNPTNPSHPLNAIP